MYTTFKNHSAFNKRGEAIHSKVAIHPGEILKDEIEDRGLKKNYVARKLGIKPSHLSDLFRGKRNISAELALQLENVLEINAEFWLRAQAFHDLTIVRNKHREMTI